METKFTEASIEIIESHDLSLPNILGHEEKFVQMGDNILSNCVEAIVKPGSGKIIISTSYSHEKYFKLDDFGTNMLLPVRVDIANDGSENTSKDSR